MKAIQKLEDGVDELDIAVANYITLTFQSNLSEKESHQLRAMLKIIENLESIADMSYQLSLTISRKNMAAAWFTPDLRNNLNELFGLVDKSLDMMTENLAGDFSRIDFEKVKSIELEINDLRSKLKQIYIEGLKNNQYPHHTGVFYNEMVSLLEKIGDHVFNVNYAIYTVK